MDESRKFSLVVRLKVPPDYLSTLCTASAATVRPSANIAPFRAPVAIMTNQSYASDNAPSTSAPVTNSWVGLNEQNLLAIIGTESPPEPAQQADGPAHDIRKVVEKSRYLVSEKDKPQPPLRAIEGAPEILTYPREPWAKHVKQPRPDPSNATTERDAKEFTKAETHTKAPPRSRSRSLPKPGSKPNKTPNAKVVPETDRILRSQSRADLATKPEASATHRAPTEPETSPSPEPPEDRESEWEMHIGMEADAQLQREANRPAREVQVLGEKKRRGWVRKVLPPDGDGEMAVSWTKGRAGPGNA